MNNFIVKFKILLDSEDKKGFVRFIILLFISGVLSLCGIGAVIPFVNVLISPDKIMKYRFLHSFSYNEVMIGAVLLLIISFWIKDIISFWSLCIQSKYLFRLSAKIARKLFHGYMNMPYIWHMNNSSPRLIRNINNESVIFTSNIVMPLGTVLTEAISSSLVFVVLLLINFIFTAIIGSFLFCTMFFYLKHSRNKARYYGEKRALAWMKMTKTVMQGLGGIKETKLYHQEQIFENKFNDQTIVNAKSGAFASVYQQSARFLIEAVAITVVLSLLTGYVFLDYSGKEIMVLLTVFGVAAVQVLPSLNRLMQALSLIKYGMPALDIISSELQKIKDVPYIANDDVIALPFDREISLNKISFAYGDKVVLNDVSLNVRSGQKIAFVGESGAGKTTLVDVIMGILKNKTGQISIDGQLIDDENTVAWQKNIGYIPQQIYIYDATLRENIAVGVGRSDIDDRKVKRSLEIAQLHDLIDKMPNGLSEQVGENGIKLSGGQRQRLGIARALYHNPSVLVMDEATAALDNQTEKEFTEALSMASQSRTIITIAHRLSTIKDYDVIYVLNNGAIVSYGSFDDLLVKCSYFKRIASDLDKRYTQEFL